MEIDEDVYRKFSWNPTVITKKDEELLSTEPIVDVVALAYSKVEQQRRSNRDEYLRQHRKICTRYDNQSSHSSPTQWLNYTPKQLKRMRKQTNKWRKRLIGEYF